MADTTNAAEVVRTVKARGRRAASDLKATTAQAVTQAATTADEAQGLLQMLGEQVNSLAQQVEHFAGDRYGDARDIAAGVADAGAVAAARASRQTVATANAIRRDPLPTLVALGLLGLLLAVVFGRGNQR